MHVYGVHIGILYFEGAHILSVTLHGQQYFFLSCHLILAGSHFLIFFMSSSCRLEFLGGCRFLEYLCTPALFHNHLW